MGISERLGSFFSRRKTEIVNSRKWEQSRRMTDSNFYGVLSEFIEMLIEEKRPVELWETSHRYSQRYSLIMAFDFEQSGKTRAIRYSIDQFSKVAVEYSAQDGVEGWNLLEIEDRTLGETFGNAVVLAEHVDDFIEDLRPRAIRTSIHSLVN